jgi:hypothetical protein
MIFLQKLIVVQLLKKISLPLYCLQFTASHPVYIVSILMSTACPGNLTLLDLNNPNEIG